MQTEGDREPPPHKNPPLCTQPGGGFTNSSKTRCCRTINCKIFVTFVTLKLLCVVINVLTYVNQNRNHLAVLDFST